MRLYLPPLQQGKTFPRPPGSSKSHRKPNPHNGRSHIYLEPTASLTGQREAIQTLTPKAERTASQTMLKTRDGGLAMAPMFAIQQQAVCGRIRGAGDGGSQPLRLLMSLSLVGRMSSEGLGRDVFAITLWPRPFLRRSVENRSLTRKSYAMDGYYRVGPLGRPATRWYKKDFWRRLMLFRIAYF